MCVCYGGWGKGVNLRLDTNYPAELHSSFENVHSRYWESLWEIEITYSFFGSETEPLVSARRLI